MQRIPCATIWGGIREESIDVCSRSVEASLYSSAAEGGKGGDIYFLSVCGHDALTRVALADVAGHGKTVSDVSQWLFECLESSMESVEGNRVLADLNALAVERGISALTTGAVVGFYSEDSKVYFSYAGHHPMLVLRAEAKRWEPAEIEGEDGANLPLGVLGDVRYDQDAFVGQAGDRLFLYTDGLVEAPNGAGERFGEERLRGLLDAHADASLIQLKQAVLDAALDFSGGSLAHDDTTVIALSIR